MTQQDIQLIHTATLNTVKMEIQEEVARVVGNKDYADLSEEDICKVVDSRVKENIKGILSDVYGLMV